MRADHMPERSSILRFCMSVTQHPCDLLACHNCRYFPTILIVMLAVFNDGAMIALSKDRVISSPVPNSWNLRNIFIIGTLLTVEEVSDDLCHCIRHLSIISASFEHDQVQLPRSWAYIGKTISGRFASTLFQDACICCKRMQ